MPSRKMKFSDINPEIRTAARLMPPLPLGFSLGRNLVRTGVKVIVKEKKHDGITLSKVTLPHNKILRIYTPANIRSDGAVLWIHGGGMVIGSPLQDEEFCVSTALDLGVIVASVSYRLAPESPFPAALDDCYEAWNWLQQNATTIGINNDKVVIGGQSAGGGLAATLIQKLIDEKGTQPIAQWLFCPMLDDRTVLNHDLDVIQHKLWSNKLNKIGWKSYLGVEPGSDYVPLYSVAARRTNLEGTPQTWIGVGSIELFYSEDIAYSERLKAAGIHVTVDVVPGAFHAFERITATTVLGKGYLSRSYDWLKSRI